MVFPDSPHKKITSLRRYLTTIGDNQKYLPSVAARCNPYTARFLFSSFRQLSIRMALYAYEFTLHVFYGFIIYYFITARNKNRAFFDILV